MWKPMAVVGLWGMLVAAPHMGAPRVTATLAGVLPSPAVPSEDPVDPDLGDPPLQAAANVRANVPTNVPARPRELAGTFATVRFENDLGKTLALTSATVTMDGKPLPAVTRLATGNETVLYAGRVTPGPHSFETHLSCRGQQRGPFTYMQDIKWNVSSTETLDVPRERAVIFTIAAVRHPGVNVPFNKQVDIAVRSQLVPEKVSQR